MSNKSVKSLYDIFTRNSFGQQIWAAHSWIKAIHLCIHSTNVFENSLCTRHRQWASCMYWMCLVWKASQFLFCVNDHLCLLLEITLFVTQTYSNTREVYMLYEVKNTTLIQHFRKDTFKFKYLMPQANLLEFEMNIYFCNFPVNN